MHDSHSQLLQAMSAERGYILSYHEILGKLEPDLLKKYGEFYRHLTLQSRFLSPGHREIVWISLLVTLRETVGDIHLKRASLAGLPPASIVAAVRLAAVGESWASLEFAHTDWSEYLIDSSAEDEYSAMVESGRGPIEGSVADLALLDVHAAGRRERPFLIHMERLYAAGVPSESIGEALSFLLIPAGANAFLWATDVWRDALLDGIAPSHDVLSGALG